MSPTCPEFDPLTLSLRLDTGHAGRDVADDPMMVELVASLSVIQTAGAPPPVLAAPAVGEAPELPSSPVCSGHAGQDVAEDPMLVEVVASLPVVQTVEGNGGSASTIEDSNVGGVLSV
jgi:hypothetical protein